MDMPYPTLYVANALYVVCMFSACVILYNTRTSVKSSPAANGGGQAPLTDRALDGRAQDRQPQVCSICTLLIP